MTNFEIPQRIQQLDTDISRNQLKYHHKRVAVSKEFTFDAAHHLHAYEGKCRSLHGHTYKLIIHVSGYVNDIGIAIDFQDLKSIYQYAIESKLDHQYLNDVLPAMNTTAENMVVWMWEQLEAELGNRGFTTQGLRLEELTLYETPTSHATVRREWMDADDE